MNLVSCGGCGVVLDKDELSFPDEEDWNESNSAWDGYTYVAFVLCPVCNHRIMESS